MQKTHGEIKRVGGKRVASPEYRSWQMMRNRCNNPKAVDYAHYGGRGITVCARWKSFESFLSDMGRRPDTTYTLERRNSEGGYTPRNCCWATRKAQARNRRYATTRVWELAPKLGVSEATARHYLWVLRRELQKTPTRYGIPLLARKIILKHMGKNI